MLIRDYVLFIISHYNNYTVDDVLNMRLSEISLLRQAINLREEREIQKIHLDNWLSRVVNATNSAGDKYMFKSFDEFYKNEKVDESAPIKSKSKTKTIVESNSSKRTKEDIMKIALNLREYHENN